MKLLTQLRAFLNSTSLSAYESPSNSFISLEDDAIDNSKKWYKVTKVNIFSKNSSAVKAEFDLTEAYEPETTREDVIKLFNKLNAVQQQIVFSDIKETLDVRSSSCI